MWARPLALTSCSAGLLLSEHAQLEEGWPNYSTELFGKEKTSINHLKIQFNDTLLKSIACVALFFSPQVLLFISEQLNQLEFNMFKTWHALIQLFQKMICSHKGHLYAHQTREYCPICPELVPVDWGVQSSSWRSYFQRSLASTDLFGSSNPEDSVIRVELNFAEGWTSKSKNGHS